MSKLENLVPPLELCKQIPDGEFRDSALVWCRVRGENDVCPREQWVGVGGTRPIPAPTLEEIINKLPHEYEDCRFYVCDNGIEYATHDGVEEALLLWFEIKGIKVK